jgi:hypothetical protein
MDWNKLEEVHLLAREKEVGYSLNYDEGADSWYFTVLSAAPSEGFIGKNHSYELAIECVITHLRSL